MSEPAPKTKTRHRVASRDEIPKGGCKIVRINRGGRDIELGVFRIGDDFRAYRNICPHAGAPVCEGRVTGTTLPSEVYEYDYSAEKLVLRCPWHGWEFDLKTGAHLVDESTKLKPIEVAVGDDETASENLESYPVEAEGNAVYILI